MTGVKKKRRGWGKKTTRRAPFGERSNNAPRKKKGRVRKRKKTERGKDEEKRRETEEGEKPKEKKEREGGGASEINREKEGETRSFRNKKEGIDQGGGDHLS